jgi:hypothetical protein
MSVCPATCAVRRGKPHGVKRQKVDHIHALTRSSATLGHVCMRERRVGCYSKRRDEFSDAYRCVCVSVCVCVCVCTLSKKYFVHFKAFYAFLLFDGRIFFRSANVSTYSFAIHGVGIKEVNFETAANVDACLIILKHMLKHV